jgi:hypothetical protein
MTTKNMKETTRVGDYVTEVIFTDREVYKVIARTKCTLTLQRVKATRITKPEFIVGGFAGHCTNNDKIKYTYEDDPSGMIKKAHWSRLREEFQTKIGAIIDGAHEYYDYNF